MYGLKSTAEVSRETGIPESTLKLWTRKGLLSPAVQGQGRGSGIAFSEDNVAQARALYAITRAFGDGYLTAAIIEQTVAKVRRGAGGITFAGVLAFDE